MAGAFATIDHGSQCVLQDCRSLAGLSGRPRDAYGVIAWAVG
jgi:hypothetical protein